MKMIANALTKQKECTKEIKDLVKTITAMLIDCKSVETINKIVLNMFMILGSKESPDLVRNALEHLSVKYKTLRTDGINTREV